jgi:hypothetical protein
MDTHQLAFSQGEADGVSDGGMTLQAVGGVNLPCGWYRVRGQLPSTGRQEHTHTHTPLIDVICGCHYWTPLMDTINGCIYLPKTYVCR